MGSRFFEDSGSKIRKIVDIVYTIVLVLHGIGAFVLLILVFANAELSGLYILGILALAISAALSYLSMLELAAFAELVENSQSILDELRCVKKTTATTRVIGEDRGMRYEPPKKPVKREEPKVVKKEAEGVKTVYCPKCGKSQFEGRNYCFACGTPLKEPEGTQK